MIFVTVGNWHKGFDRLVKYIDELVQQGLIQEPVVMQIGHGAYKPKHTEWFDYCSDQQFEQYVQQARVVVCHGGVGSIGIALRYNKPVIAIPRKAKLGECFDDHQFTTVRQLEQEEKILAAYEVGDILDALKKSIKFMPKINHQANAMIEAIDQYLQILQKVKSQR